MSENDGPLCVDREYGFEPSDPGELGIKNAPAGYTTLCRPTWACHPERAPRLDRRYSQREGAGQQVLVRPDGDQLNLF